MSQPMTATWYDVQLPTGAKTVHDRATARDWAVEGYDVHLMSKGGPEPGPARDHGNIADQLRREAEAADE